MPPSFHIPMIASLLCHTPTAQPPGPKVRRDIFIFVAATRPQRQSRDRTVLQRTPSTPLSFISELRASQKLLVEIEVAVELASEPAHSQTCKLF